MGQLVGGPQAAISHHIAVFLCRLEKMPEGILPEIRQTAEKLQQAWSRCE
jgi:hypothetical protein